MGNRYLEDSFAPLADEHTLTDLAVEGVLPDHLDGRYLRNGPNPVGEIDPALYHWFAGDGMVHGISLRDGRAQWYRNRWVRSPLVSRALGEPVGAGHSGMSPLGANTNVVGHAGRTLALVEGGLPVYELTDELDTVGVGDFDGTLAGGYTAHPKRDPVTGELHAVSYRMDRGGTVQYSVIGADGRARRTVDITVTGSPMMHDFSLTERHVVFYDLPVTFDVRAAVAMTVPRPLRLPARLLLSALVGRVRIPDPISARMPTPPTSDRRLPFGWNPDYPARVGVMPREGGDADVRWFDVEPCYVFHPLNAHDGDRAAGDTVVLDVVRHPKMFDTCRLGPDEGPPTLDRWTVDLSDGKVREERLDDRPQEFPRVDERHVGRPHRYGWSAGAGAEPVLFKHDLLGGGSTARHFGRDAAIGEFVFSPSSPEAPEGDGVVMGYVWDRPTDRSALVVLDAQTLDDVARVPLPHRVPAGFHGNWLPRAAS